MGGGLIIWKMVNLNLSHTQIKRGIEMSNQRELLKQALDAINYLSKQANDGTKIFVVRDIEAELEKEIEKPVAYMTTDKKMLVFADKVLEPEGMTPLYESPLYDGRTVQEIEREASDKERDACSELADVWCNLYCEDYESGLILGGDYIRKVRSFE